MANTGIPIRNWRVVEAEPHGLQLWFDPLRERPSLHLLEPSPGGGVAKCNEGDDLDDLDGLDPSEILTAIRAVDPSF